MEVRNQLIAAGFSARNKDQIIKKWEDVSSATKAKYAKRKQSGGGAVEWTEVDEAVTEILGKENPFLAAISGGIDPGETLSPLKTPLMNPVKSQKRLLQFALSVSHEVQGQDESRSTFSERPEKLNSDQKEEAAKEDFKEERNKSNLKHDNRSGERNTLTDIQKIYEEQLKEEHEAKMRILRKKEQLLDLKIQLLREKRNRDSV